MTKCYPIVLTIALLCFVATTLTPAWAQFNPGANTSNKQTPYWEEQPSQMGNRGQGGGDHFLKQLNLSREQKQRLQALIKGHQQERRANREAMQQKHQQLMQMLQSGSGSKDQVLSLQRELANQRSSLMEDRINTIYGLKSILSPQQFEQFQAHMKQRQGQQGKGFQREGRQNNFSNPNF